MTELQNNIYKYLKEIDEICRKHGIEYYLAGGTLIGAIRHEGFLPWDDDADILMTRDNWEKFLRLYKEGAFPENRVLEATEINVKYPNVIGRYMDTSKTAIHGAQLADDEPAGMIVDVLTLDPIPADAALQQQYLEDLALYSDLVNPKDQYSIRYGKNVKRYKICRFLMKVGMTDAVLKYLRKRMFSYKEEDCEYYALRWAGCGLFSRKEIYGKPKDIRFVDTDMMIPSCPEEYLIWHFGLDWELVPPHDERMSHNAIYDMNEGYKTVRGRIEKYIDGERLRNAALTRKELRMKYMDNIHMRADKTIALSKTMVVAEQKELLARQKVDVRELVEQRQYATILEIFEPYITFATSRPVIGRQDFSGAFRYYRPIFTDIGTENFEAVITAMTHTESVSRVARFLEVFRLSGGTMTPCLQEMDDLAEEIKVLSERFWAAEYDQVRSRVEELLEKYPENQSLLRLEIKTLLRQEEEDNNLLLHKWIRKARSLYPEDGELEKYEGDLAVREGNILQGLLLYYGSSEHSINGVIALDIRRYLRNHIQETVKAVEVPGALELKDLEGFLDYICERGEEHPKYVALKYRLLEKKAQTAEEYAALNLKMEETSWSLTEEFEALRENGFVKLAMSKEDQNARHEYKKAQRQGTLQEYADSCQQRYDELSYTEHKLLGDAFVQLHLIDKGYAEYHKVKNESEDAYLQAEIRYVFDQEIQKMKMDFESGRYPEAVLIHGLKKRFGQSKDYENIISQVTSAAE